MGYPVHSYGTQNLMQAQMYKEQQKRQTMKDQLALDNMQWMKKYQATTLSFKYLDKAVELRDSNPDLSEQFMGQYNKTMETVTGGKTFSLNAMYDDAKTAKEKATNYFNTIFDKDLKDAKGPEDFSKIMRHLALGEKYLGKEATSTMKSLVTARMNEIKDTQKEGIAQKNRIDLENLKQKNRKELQGPQIIDDKRLFDMMNSDNKDPASLEVIRAAAEKLGYTFEKPDTTDSGWNNFWNALAKKLGFGSKDYGASDQPNGTTATGSDGAKIITKNGRWVGK